MIKTFLQRILIFRDHCRKNTTEFFDKRALWSRNRECPFFISKKPKQTGFTLVEILVVIGLIGFIMAVAVPNFGLAVKINISNSSRELASTIRTMRDEAVLKGTVYRIVFDIEKSQYWVEVGERDFLMRTADQQEAEKRLNEKRSEEEKKDHADSFQMAKTITKKKQTLPKGVHFTDIITSISNEPTKAGVVYAHAFPHGFLEKLIVHLKDSYDRECTLSVNSVSGKSLVVERYVPESEL